MEWSFHYHGPREPKMDFKCVTCLSGKTEECPTHGKTPPDLAEGVCAHCAAAQGAPCQAHWGVEAALNAHVVDAASSVDFEAAKALALDELALTDRKTVLVRMRGDGHLDSTGHRELHIEIIAV